MVALPRDPEPRPRPRFEREFHEPQVTPWEEFEPIFFTAHKRGEHVALVGPNGTGKTLTGLTLCKIIGRRTDNDRRPTRIAVLQYKPQDKTLAVVSDWPIIKQWPPAYGEEQCIVWPRGATASQAAKLQRRVFLPLLDTVYIEGKQTVYIPEAAYFERHQPAGLGMAGTMEQLWSTARSNELTVISDTQRPRMVTILMWTEPAWVFVYRLENRDDIKRVADLSGYPDEVWDTVPRLGEHECLVIRRQRHAGMRQLYITKVTNVTRNNRNQQRERRTT